MGTAPRLITGRCRGIGPRSLRAFRGARCPRMPSSLAMRRDAPGAGVVQPCLASGGAERSGRAGAAWQHIRGGEPGLPTGLLDLPLGRDRASGSGVNIDAAVLRPGSGRAPVTDGADHKGSAYAAETTPYPGQYRRCLPGAGGRCAGAHDAVMTGRTVPVTIHCSLREAIDRVTREAVLDTLRITHTALQSTLFAAAPRASQWWQGSTRIPGKGYFGPRRD